MATYNELMTAIVKKEIATIGATIALKLARKVPGITVDDTGNVTGGSKATLQQLVDSYKTIAGSIATMFAKNAIKYLLAGDEDLPDELK